MIRNDRLLYVQILETGNDARNVIFATWYSTNQAPCEKKYHLFSLSNVENGSLKMEAEIVFSGMEGKE